ncbi:hypothetical protein PI124_g22828 [Phytophthora idaei]|nr:hypothetical protein PI126_g22782 [Phytophthora idaei]KAG3232083.1 hypothetical protein PI124_g22828 [Phytophthora idaei]
MARIKCVSGVLLLCVLSVYGGNPVGELDQFVAAKVEETQRAFVNVEKQLSEAQQMTELFALEDTQLQLFILETRAKLTVVQEEVQNEMDAAMLEVDRMRQEAVKNITTWKKRLQELREATQKNEQTLQNIREKKEKQKREIQRELELQKEQEMKAKRELEMLQELERQREVKKELEEKDLKRLQELEQQELEKQRVLEQLQVLEKQQQIQQELEKMRELEKQQKEMQKASSFDSAKSSDGADNTLASDDTQRTSTVKRVLTCASRGGNFGLLSRVNGVNREIQHHEASEAQSASPLFWIPEKLSAKGEATADTRTCRWTRSSTSVTSATRSERINRELKASRGLRAEDLVQANIYI